MDILIATTELAPFAKVGGLADAITGLAKTLRILGHRVTVVIPYFSKIKDSGMLFARRLTPLTLPLGQGVRDVYVYDGRHSSGIELILLDIHPYFERAEIYGENGQDYDDNGIRFALFSRAVTELIRLRQESPQPFDVVHANDWPTALIPYLLKTNNVRVATVFAIHNLWHQGIFHKNLLEEAGIGFEHFRTDALEFYGKVNLLKGALVSSDVIVAVSPTYASEIQTPEQGCHLEGVVASAKSRLMGISNGIDYAVWNPLTDTAISARYDWGDPSNKIRCKMALLHELGFELNPRKPLVAMVGRLTFQKGCDAVVDAAQAFWRNDVNLVVTGSGNADLVERFQKAQTEYPDHIAYLGFVAEDVVHRIFAGADFVLMPSRAEPCGLVALMAQRYGAIPIATRTGGLIDSIVDIDGQLETGTGIFIEDVTERAVVAGIQRAIAAINHPRWQALVKRCMRLDLSWDRSARQYVQAYRHAINTRPQSEAGSESH